MPANSRKKEVVIWVTHQELAELIGASRETTTLTLKRLSREGLLSTGGGRFRGKIVIKNPGRLRQLAAE